MFFSRGKNKIQDPITIVDFYDGYSKSVEKGSPYDLTKEEFTGICYLFFKLASDKIIDEGKELKIPSLGTFSVSKKMTRMSNIMYAGVDFKLTNELGFQVKYTNDHTGGYKYFFRWMKVGNRLRNINKYRFIPTRRNKRHLAYVIKNKKRDYFEL